MVPDKYQIGFCFEQQKILTEHSGIMPSIETTEVVGAIVGGVIAAALIKNNGRICRKANIFSNNIKRATSQVYKTPVIDRGRTWKRIVPLCELTVRE